MDNSPNSPKAKTFLAVAAMSAGLLLFTPGPPATACTSCHTMEPMPAAKDPHLGGGVTCQDCHGGDGTALTTDSAHLGLIASPGELDQASASCGGCHADKVASVMQGLMHTGAGIVSITRNVVTADHSAGHATLSDLGNSPADSLLRKLCAGCHLGQPLTDHGGDPVDDRGGGCLACHLRDSTAGRHPGLTAKVSDARCFGCHSRSGRISLNYAGLAETERTEGNSAVRLSDGRILEHRQPDVHHRAGMGCIDCHTGPGLMGAFSHDANGSLDISCTDCHANQNPRIQKNDWPGPQLWMLERVPFTTTSHSRFLTTTKGTPLWHVEVRGNALPLLHRKADGHPLPIPQVGNDHFPLPQEHASLNCVACHANWAPQCYGCHIDFEPDALQWDHQLRMETPGAWHERRWDIRNTLPPLGRLPDERITTFVPGMILALDHPELQEQRFVRRFAPLSPHTTGKSRTCTECHRDPVTLGLGSGRLDSENGRLVFSASKTSLRDGLPADAWTSLEATPDSRQVPHPFSPEEIRRIFSAPLDMKRRRP